MNKFTKFLYALLIIIPFTISVAFSQVKVIHFNAGWNEAKLIRLRNSAINIFITCIIYLQFFQELL